MTRKPEGFQYQTEESKLFSIDNDKSTSKYVHVLERNSTLHPDFPLPQSETDVFTGQDVEKAVEDNAPYVELITPTDPAQRGCQLSAMFSVPVTGVFQALQKRGVVVCKFLAKLTQKIFIFKFIKWYIKGVRKTVPIPLIWTLI